MSTITRESRLAKARTRILMTDDAKYVFLANLCEIPNVMDSTIDTAGTDGSSIRWNPEYVDSISDQELLAITLHELMHVGLLHVCVANQYDDQKRFNIAADLAVNSILREIGATLPAGCLLPGVGEFANVESGKSLEHYFRILQDMDDSELPEEQPGGVEQAGSEQAKNTPDGNVPVPDPGMASEIVRAMVKESLEKAQSCGELPECLAEAVGNGLEHKVDYRTALKRIRTKICRGGADWTRPNKRLRAAGANVARNRTRKVGTVLVLWDCSGSMSTATGHQCLAEIMGIFQEAAGSVHVWQHDTVVVHKDELRHGAALPTIERKTRGCTSHVEPFQNIEDSGIRPDVVICLSDCQTRYPYQFPNCPIIWISDVPVSRGNRPPVGELLDILI